MSHHKTPDAPAGMLVLDQRAVILMEMFAGADEAFQALHTDPEYQPDAQTLALAKQTSSTLAFELARHMLVLANKGA
ncbi:MULTISPECIES: hypothetical protein [Pseudomonas]|uniref:Uncharacterized protein n=1 Tax=Pseudomonas syringae pv. papulans TaxID=83963 RepID=A0AA43IXN1_PSESX|nr:MULTISPECIES: hypothetical protein [Pseudomonas]MDH4603723.1 hypothetical protein [Pseudomonas syringae pv. papulans]MDH4625534.1 hypothetical protein [Pseudomonas syringae pv. papulans]